MEVLADPQAIRKVIGNLTHNALKYTPNDGHITIRAVWRNEGADVEISITTPASGFHPRICRVSLNAFTRWTGRTSTQGELRGTGLGTAIARRISKRTAEKFG